MRAFASGNAQLLSLYDREIIGEAIRKSIRKKHVRIPIASNNLLCYATL